MSQDTQDAALAALIAEHAAMPLVERLERQREVILAALDVELGLPLGRQPVGPPEEFVIAGRCRELAAALLDIDRVLAANRQLAGPAPEIDWSKLLIEVWDECQEGAVYQAVDQPRQGVPTTAFGDIAVEALKRVLGAHGIFGA